MSGFKERPEGGMDKWWMAELVGLIDRWREGKESLRDGFGCYGERRSTHGVKMEELS